MKETLEAVGINPIESLGNGWFKCSKVSNESAAIAREKITKNIMDKIATLYANDAFQKELTQIGKIEKEQEEGKKLAYELQKRLVQCCIDFINENKDCNIDYVSFTADMLQESAKYGEWQPCTDSTCHIENSNREEIGFSA